MTDIQRVRGTGTLYPPKPTTAAEAPPEQTPKTGTGSLNGDGLATNGGDRMGGYAPDPLPAPTPPPQEPKPAGNLWNAFKSVVTTTTTAVASFTAKPGTSRTKDSGHKIDEAKQQAAEKAREYEARHSRTEEATRQANAKVELSDSLEPIAAKLDPEELQALKELSVDQRAKFGELYEQLGGLKTDADPGTRQAVDGLERLLKEGTLETKDFMGGSLLDTFHSRLKQTPDAQMGDVTPQSLLQTVINHIAAPTAVSQGKDTNTCACAALQTIVANQDPAEYARLATGLAFDGKVSLKGGEEMVLDASEVGKLDDDGRSPLSQAIQGTFKKFAEQFPEEGTEDYGGGRLGRGRFGGGRLGSGGKYGDGTLGSGTIGGANGGQVNGGGLTQNQIEKLYESVIDKLAVKIPVTPENMDAVMDGVVRTLQNDQPVPVGVRGQDSAGRSTHHVVTVLGIDLEEGKGEPTVTFSDPGTAKEHKMPLSEFQQVMEAVVIPAEYANHASWQLGDIDEMEGLPGRKGLPAYKREMIQ